MEVAVKHPITPSALTLELPDSVLVVERDTGEIIDVVGDRGVTNIPVAKATAVATAALSSLEDTLGTQLLRIEVMYSTASMVIEIDDRVFKVFLRRY